MRASGQMEITTNSSPGNPQDDCLPCLGREGHLPRRRLRVRRARAALSLGHDRRGVGGARPAGPSGDGRVASGPGRAADGPPAAGGGGRDPLPGPLRGGMAGAAGGFPAVAGGVCVLRTVGRPGPAQRVVDRLRGQLRTGVGRDERPTAAVIDSQSVKAADTVGAATSGFDGGKKIKGRKRHVAVDSNGWLLAVLVTAASVQDRDTGHRLVALLRERFSTITLVWADGGYAGRLVA